VSIKAAVRSCGLALAALLASTVFAADLTNPGFEDSPIGAAPAGWSIYAAVDAAKVVGTEGPANFPIYAERNVTVVPFAEAQALRLGTPRPGNNSQPKGWNKVMQTFVPAARQLRIPLRLLSFEHRGDDKVYIDVLDGKGTRYPVSLASGGAFTFPGLTGSAKSCAQTPCWLTVDVGNNGTFLDSGWQVLVIDDLPTAASVTLKVGFNTAGSGSHPTWLYVDGEARNSPPVARIDFSPGQAPGTIALEGDFVSFNCAQSTDPDGDDLTCRWRATGSTIPELTAEGPVAFFVFPDDDQITMTLTVDDGALTHTTSTQVAIQNGAPLVSAIEWVEVPLDGRGQALCRFLDPGVQDGHSAAFSFNGAPLDADVQEENLPSLASGYARATLDVAGLEAGTYDGECTVADNSGAATTRAFTVAVLTPEEIAARENADTDASIGAPVVRAGRTILTALEGSTDVDVIEIVSRDGSAIPVGAEINVTVDVPVDYDAILLSRSAGAENTPFVNAPFVNAPFVNAPFVNVPFVNVPFVNAPFVNAPFVNVPFVNAPFVNAPFVNAPFVNAPLETSPFVNAGYTFDNFPLSQVGLAAPDGGQISGIDVGLGELGSYNLGALQSEALGVKALSAQLGTSPERILVRVGPGEDAVFLALVSHAGVASPAPASVTVEIATPPSQRQLLGAQNCEFPPGAELVPTDKTSSTDVLHAQADPRTLVFTQRERFMATWQQTRADYDEWLALMAPYFDDPSIRARVISLPSSIYDAADLDTCDVAKQNAVAAQIRDIVRAELEAHPGIRYLQILGGPDIVPVYFTPDETTISYEGLYASELWMQPGKPLAVALAEGYNPTDAYYADLDPQSFRGRELYLEDLPLGRLGERPAEILDTALTFLAQNGQPIATALVTGYDFFADGAEATASVLERSASVTRRIDDAWTADDLRCDWLGAGGCGAPPDLTALNAHMSYNALLSANGFALGSAEDTLSCSEASGRLAGKTILSIGCHSGLNFPDAWAIPQDLAGLSFDPGRDWVQDAGTWVAPWTYGIGDDTVADRGTEGIMTLVTEELAAGRSLGDALVRAKQRYATGLFEFGVYDEKSLVGLGLFGVPQTTIASVASLASTGGVAAAGVPVGTFTLDLLEQGASSSVSYALEQQANARGTWYSFDGDAQAVFGRPLLPSAKPIEARSVAPGQTSVHGVALRGGRYVDYLDVDPVFPAPRHDWTESVDEPQPCVQTSSPTQLAVVSTVESAGRPLETLIVQGGQFRCTRPADPATLEPVAGEMRIFEALTLEALHPASAALESDYAPPTVLRQDVTANPSTGDVTALLDASDESGLREIIGLVYADDDGVPGGSGAVTSFSTGDLTGQAGPYVLVLPGARDNRLAFQYIDAAGNLLQKSLKGSLISAVDVNILTTQVSSGGPTSLSVFVGGYEALDGASLEIDFGDGSAPVVYDLSALPLPPGVTITLQPPAGSSGDCADPALVCDGVIVVEKDYGDAPFGASITVVATIRANGAVGTDTAVLSRCGDAAGDASANADIVACSFSSSGTQVAIDLEVAGSIANGIYYKLVVGNRLFWYLNGRAYCSFSGVSYTVKKVSSKRLRFTFDGSKVGWNGTSPFQFKERTVSAYFPWNTLDETATQTGSP